MIARLPSVDLLVEVLQRGFIWCFFGDALSDKDISVQRLYVQAVLMRRHIRPRWDTRRKYQTRRGNGAQRKPANDLHGSPKVNPDIPPQYPPGTGQT
jgi:hypothetical protein